ncbi:ankyrin [Parathielavia appendiculata]|uniref:Ankyrin n=1 Tax=Parathielavia appendiculata TaxID=2587402 RepID=A0AAN6U1S1_9PEZI|nr:ankyrin [Parathielavia appendiculata]
MDHDRDWLGRDMTPLHLAVEKRDDPLVHWSDMDKSEEILTEILLSAGADPNTKTSNGNTPMHIANTEKPRIFELLPNVKVFDMLLELGADVNIADGNGDNVFHHILHSINSLADSREFMTNKKSQPPLFSYNKCGFSSRTALARHHDEMLRMLVGVGMDLNARDEQGRTILWVIGEQYGTDVDVIEKFIRLSADPGAATDDGRTTETYPRAQEVILVLMDEGTVSPLAKNAEGQSALHVAADPTTLATSNLSPLHVAARKRDAGVAVLLLVQYRKLSVLEEHVNLLGEGRAPLHYACRAGSPEAVWYLLRNGADPSIMDGNGLTSLHALTECEAPGPPPMVDIIAMLQRGGADLTAEAAIRMDGETRMLTPLDMAVQRKNWEMVRALITHGVQPRDCQRPSEEFVLATDRASGIPKGWSDSPVERTLGGWSRGENASREGNLLHDQRTRHPGFESPEPADEDGNAADCLCDVLQDGDYDIIKEYAQLGGNMIQLRRWSKDIFLHHLIRSGQAELSEYFGDKVAEFEAQDWVQKNKNVCCTLLGAACLRSQPSLQIIQLLVEKLGVDVNATYNPDGFCYRLRRGTALHILASGANFWQVEALEYLLSKGADIKARNADGMTPLLAAIDKSWPDGFWREETVCVLLKHGADVNATARKLSGVTGRSALEMSGHPGVTRLLLEHGASRDWFWGLLTYAVCNWMEPGIMKLPLEAGLDPNELPSCGGDQQQEKRLLKGVIDDEEVEQKKGGGEDEEREEWGEEEEEEEEEEPKVEPRYPLHEAARPSTAYDPAFNFRRGSKLDRKGHHGRTLLTSACIPVFPVGAPVYGVPKPKPTVVADAINALVTARADALALDDEAALLCTDKQGRKPLHLALAINASRAQISSFLIQHLLSVGVNPADPDPLTGNSALHFIAPRLVGESTAAAAATTLFLELAAHLDINARNGAGETPVFAFAAVGWAGTRNPESKVGHPTYALKHDMTHAKALDMFVELGADLVAVDGKNRTLLHVTAGRKGVRGSQLEPEEMEDVEGAFKKLLDLGIHPRAEDDQLRTAIDVTVARNMYGIVWMFSEEGRREREKGMKDDGGKESGSGDFEW